MSAAKFDTREGWLLALVDLMRPRFIELGAPLPERLRVSVGWPSVKALGGRGKTRRIGECWPSVCSQDGTIEIFISPVVHEPLEVADILAHELVHAALDGQNAGHGPKFRKLAKAIGLEGKMTATVGGEEFRAWVEPLVATLGEYPHAGLDRVSIEAARKKQTTRMVKCQCASCGYIARTTRKWLEEVGAPLCACNHETMEVAA